MLDDGLDEWKRFFHYFRLRCEIEKNRMIDLRALSERKKKNTNAFEQHSSVPPHTLPSNSKESLILGRFE